MRPGVKIMIEGSLGDDELVAEMPHDAMRFATRLRDHIVELGLPPVIHT